MNKKIKELEKRLESLEAEPYYRIKVLERYMSLNSTDDVDN